MQGRDIFPNWNPFCVIQEEYVISFENSSAVINSKKGASGVYLDRNLFLLLNNDNTSTIMFSGCLD